VTWQPAKTLSTLSTCGSIVHRPMPGFLPEEQTLGVISTPHILGDGSVFWIPAFAPRINCLPADTTSIRTAQAGMPTAAVAIRTMAALLMELR
jgi:hypothetical protein